MITIRKKYALPTHPPTCSLIEMCPIGDRKTILKKGWNRALKPKPPTLSSTNELYFKKIISTVDFNLNLPFLF